jgi:hypothetical protein
VVYPDDLLTSGLAMNFRIAMALGLAILVLGVALGWVFGLLR